MGRTFRDAVDPVVDSLKKSFREKGLKVRVEKKGKDFIALQGGVKVVDTNPERFLKKCEQTFMAY